MFDFVKNWVIDWVRAQFKNGKVAWTTIIIMIASWLGYNVTIEPKDPEPAQQIERPLSDY